MENKIIETHWGHCGKKEFDNEIDALIERYQDLVPLDDITSIMTRINATPQTQAYISELSIELKRWNRENNYDKRRVEDE